MTFAKSLTPSMQAFDSLTGANTLGFGASLFMNEGFENNGGDFNNGASFDGINAASLITAQRIDSGGHHSSSGLYESLIITRLPLTTADS